MKKNKMLTLVLTAVALQSLSAFADNLYTLSWRGTAYTTDANGKIVARSLTEKDVVNQIASDNGLNPRDLVFVYRADKLDTAVVMRTNGLFVADWQQVQYNFTTINNTANTDAVMQSFIFDENHSNAIGSLFGTIKEKRDSNGNLTSFSFHGNFQYALPEASTIVSGTFSTGKKVNETF